MSYLVMLFGAATLAAGVVMVISPGNTICLQTIRWVISRIFRLFSGLCCSLRA
jgi:hypothetical protein